METTTIKKTNGKASKSDVKTPARKTTAKKEDQPSIPQSVKTTEKTKAEIPVKETVKPELTLDQKIEKIENLKTLIEKREMLEVSRKKLNSFVVGANQFNENIVLTDENGNKFQTSNTEVFVKVVKTINETLVEKISEIESQIEF